MDTPLDEQYLTWLYSKVGNVKTRPRTRTYWKLYSQLYSKEFVWFVPNDDNRIEDGKELRYEFLEEEGIEDREVDDAWLSIGCSVLELLVGLARRLAFEAGGSSRVWFVELLENLDLAKCNDAAYRVSVTEGEIDEKLDRLIWRTYHYDGSFGGLFPLKNTLEDQREVELWFQLSAYLLER